VRAPLLILAAVPFMVLAALDLRFHLRSRKPSKLEDLLHLLLGLGQVVLIASGVRGDLPRLAVATGVVLVFGALDEFGFHHDLPARESDLHAKGHLALFGFVGAAVILSVFPDFASVQRALLP
jgi:hypothetical protein